MDQSEFVTASGRRYQRFIRHPAPVTDGTVRCIRCGQIDEEPWHDLDLCRNAPTEADFDDMHHALGRPDGPHVTPYRNRYCCAADGGQAQRFMALGLWERDCLINGGKEAFFSVTPDGVRQVMAWVVARQRAQGLRPWVVSSPDFCHRTVIAKSRSAARFSVYRDISDAYHFDDGFRGFLALGVSVKAAGGPPPALPPIPF